MVEAFNPDQFKSPFRLAGLPRRVSSTMGGQASGGERGGHWHLRGQMCRIGDQISADHSWLLRDWCSAAFAVAITRKSLGFANSNQRVNAEHCGRTARRH